MNLKRNIDTKFYHVRQNNSGGYWIENDDVAVNLIVEAQNAAEAEIKITLITRNYSQYCTCCGERWFALFDDGDGTDIPTIYGDEDIRREGTKSTIIYYFDGKKEKIGY